MLFSVINSHEDKAGEQGTCRKSGFWSALTILNIKNYIESNGRKKLTYGTTIHEKYT